MNPAGPVWSALDANGRMELLAHYLEYVGAPGAYHVKPLAESAWKGRFQKPGAVRRDQEIRLLCRTAHAVLLDRLGATMLSDTQLSRLFRAILVIGPDGSWAIPCLGVARDPRRNGNKPEAVSWFVRPTPVLAPAANQDGCWISLAAVAPGITPLRRVHQTRSRRWIRRIQRLNKLMLPDGPVRTQLYTRARDQLVRWLLRHPQ